ncbi:MAG: mechanosensitive ion channel family protein, partial [Candidatus Dormibacteraceae bacterium]
VQRINIRATTILNLDRQEVIVPNHSLITSEVTNWTRSDTINRLTVRIGVAYGSDVDRVTQLLMQIANETPPVLKEPAPSVIFAQHGDSSLDFDLRVFVPDPEKIFTARDHLNKAINRVLTLNNIEIPFPQRDVHVRPAVEAEISKALP